MWKKVRNYTLTVVLSCVATGTAFYGYHQRSLAEYGSETFYRADGSIDYRRFFDADTGCLELIYYREDGTIEREERYDFNSGTSTFEVTSFDQDGKEVETKYLYSSTGIPPEIQTEAPKEKETESRTEMVTEVQTESQTEIVTEAETESQTETVTEAVTEIQTETVTEAKTESQTEAETESQTETVTEAETESQTETVTEAVTEIQTETVTEAKTESQTETETESQTETVTEAKTESQTEIVTETVTEVQTETAMETITEKGAGPRTKAVIEILTEVATEEEAESRIEVMTEPETERMTKAPTEIQTVRKAEIQTEIETETETEAAIIDGVKTIEEDGSYFVTTVTEDEDGEFLSKDIVYYTADGIPVKSEKHDDEDTLLSTVRYIYKAGKLRKAKETVLDSRTGDEIRKTYKGEKAKNLLEENIGSAETFLNQVYVPTVFVNQNLNGSEADQFEACSEGEPIASDEERTSEEEGYEPETSEGNSEGDGSAPQEGVHSGEGDPYGVDTMYPDGGNEFTSGTEMGNVPETMPVLDLIPEVPEVSAQATPAPETASMPSASDQMISSETPDQG